MTGRLQIRVEDLLGVELLGGNNQPVGRIEEFRAVRRGHGCVLTEVVIGTSGLLERMNVATRMLFGARITRRVARWDQVDLSNPKKPRLTCAVDELAEG